MWFQLSIEVKDQKSISHPSITIFTHLPFPSTRISLNDLIRVHLNRAKGIDGHQNDTRVSVDLFLRVSSSNGVKHGGFVEIRKVREIFGGF
jgi:hypothetical protein